MQQQSRARIIIEVPETDPAPTERSITISGTRPIPSPANAVGSIDAVESAKTLIYEKIDGPGVSSILYYFIPSPFSVC